MNSMRSVFFWRVLVVSIVALLLANVALLAAYTYVGRKTYVAIEFSSLELEAEVTRQMYDEYKNGEMSYEALERLIEKQTIASESAILIVDQIGKILFLRNLGGTIERKDLGAYFSAELQHVLAGATVRNNDLELQSGEKAVSAGVPIKDADGKVTGGIFIIKQTKRIESAFQILNNALAGTILILFPLIMILTAYGTNRISRPLHDMAGVAIEMSKGRFDVRANERHSGEAGILARALNTLCDNLSATIYQLRSEKRQLNQLIASLTDGVAALDNIGCLTHYNPALMKLFGAVEVTSPMDLVPDTSVWEAFRAVYETQVPQTLHYQTSNDRTLWITIVPILTDDDECAGVVGLFKDMTEMERLETMRRDYVANVSHELRTPLTAVRGLLEPLADGMIQDDETRDRYYRIMLREVVRLSRLITDMLELSRLQTGREHMEINAVNLEELLKDTQLSFANEAEQKGISLILKAEDAPYVMTDADRVGQLLVILVDNALHYTPSGGSITIEAADSDSKRVLVSVSDTGCGISPDDLPYIFERFYKTDKSRREGGTGLGLSIGKQIIDMLGESIYVESTVDQGTSFHFTLKKYVSNAIALGPINVDQEYVNALYGVEDRPAADAESLQDAPYEIISPPKSSGNPFSFKKKGS